MEPPRTLNKMSELALTEQKQIRQRSLAYAVYYTDNNTALSQYKHPCVPSKLEYYQVKYLLTGTLVKSGCSMA